MIPSPSGDIYAVLTARDDISGQTSSESKNRSGGDSDEALSEVISGDRPLIIMCHGLMMNGSQNPIRGASDSFVGAGYDTLRIDFRGSGRSSGKITEMTPLTEVADLLNVVRFVVLDSGISSEALYEKPFRKIILCGHSLGGLVSLLAAAYLSGAEVPGLGKILSKTDSTAASPEDRALMQSALTGLVLFAPAVNIESDSREGRVAYETFDPVNVPEEVEVWGASLSRAYFLTARGLDTFDTISHYHGPACVLMGERDRIVELNLADRITGALPQAEMHIIPRGDHLFSRNSRLRATDVAIDFLARL